MPEFEDEYLDVLQNIEATIVQVYRQNRELTDYDVDKVLNALIRVYQAEQRQQTFTVPVMSSLVVQVYDGVHGICDWRLGQESLEVDANGAQALGPEPITVDEVLACLKRLRKSVERWNKEGGRRGYLDYIDQFI